MKQADEWPVPPVCVLQEAKGRGITGTALIRLGLVCSFCLARRLLCTTSDNNDSMNGSANCALFLQSSASNTSLPELTNCALAETDDYTHFSH
jgi:hypothetical protein